MNNYLHPVLILIFLLLFTVMSIIGAYRLLRDRQYFGGGLLILSTIVFGISTYIATTLA